MGRAPTGHLGNGLILLGDIWGLGWESWKAGVTRRVGLGTIWRSLCSYVWLLLGAGCQRDLSDAVGWTPTHGLSKVDAFGLPHGVTARFKE